MGFQELRALRTYLKLRLCAWDLAGAWGLKFLGCCVLDMMPSFSVSSKDVPKVATV